ncbi:DUF1330 domain-containing protein [Streptomyces sp. NPDC049954]|uniref:DUF1330 domain-containing protein n=1 Tax=Streptomyces sp. NPDC049954 TaxID=3155779 RepID=UPI0034307AEA
MTAYALAHLRPGEPHADVVTYIERIQDTLDPYEGRFLVHGAEVETLEGSWPGTVVVAFPGLEQARAWYGSPAYRALLPLRTRHLDGDTILVRGVPEDYDPRETARRMRERTEAAART